MKLVTGWFNLAFISLALVLSLVFPAAGCAPAPQGPQEETFILAVAQDVTTLDPNAAGGTASDLTPVLFQALIMWNQVDFHVTPNLAESYRSVDPKTWEIKIRKNVKFHNGDELKASDVQFTFFRNMGKINPRFRGYATATWKGLIEDVQIMDDYTVVVKTTRPEVSFPSLIGGMFIVPKAYVEQIGDEEFAKKPVGTGPFKFVERKINEYVKIEAFADYWNQKPDPGTLGPARVKYVTIRVIPEQQTSISALLAGEVGGVNGINNDNAKELEKNPKIKVYYSPRNEMWYLVMNSRNEKDPKTGTPNPFFDLKVRQAANYALNVDDLINNYMTGKEVRTTMMGRGSIGYDSKAPIYPFDPGKAKKLMADAGYSSGFNTKYYILGNSPMTDAVAQYWRNVGINAEIVVTTTAVALGELNNKSFSGLVAWRSSFGPDIASGWFPQNLKFDSPYGMAYKDDWVEGMVEKQAQEFDTQKRAGMINEVVTHILKNAWFVPLWEPVYPKTVSADWNYDHEAAPATGGIILSNISKKK